jgi:ferritin-like metal-binding protein YciE
MKLFNHQLADLYYVEKQLLKALPRMADKAESEQLSEAFLDHAQETEAHVDRLEQIFDDLGRTARGKRCEAMDGILEEAKDLMEDFKDDNALDAALVCAAQKVEHYEITTYGSLCAFADELGMNEVCDLLEKTLDEEKAADEKLSELAEHALNSAGMAQGEEEEEDEDEEEDDDRGSSSSDTEGEEDEDSDKEESESDDDQEEIAAQGDKNGNGNRNRYANA